MPTQYIAVIISLISVAYAIYSGHRNGRRTDIKDIEERAKTDAKIQIKLDLIAQTVQETNDEVKSIKTEMQKHSERLIVLEQSTKSAHHRIDGIERRLGMEVTGDE